MWTLVEHHFRVHLALEYNTILAPLKIVHHYGLNFSLGPDPAQGCRKGLSSAALGTNAPVSYTHLTLPTKRIV